MSVFREKIIEPVKIETGSIFKIKVKIMEPFSYNDLKNMSYEELKEYNYKNLKGD